MSRQKPPMNPIAAPGDITDSKVAGPIPGLDGVELPLPSGVSPQVMVRPAINMTPNDGSNPKIGSAVDFASGKDTRSFEKVGPESDPYPGKPGAA